MPRGSLTAVVLFALGFGGVLGYTWALRAVPGSEEGARDAPAAPSTIQQSTPLTLAAANEEKPAVQEPDAASGAQPAQPDAATVAGWVAEAKSMDPVRRAEAITALSKAPKSQAVPALRRVLDAGDLEDGQHALRSLNTLALEQGDADKSIQNVLRRAKYHVGDPSLVQEVQAALDSIESGDSQTNTRVQP